MRDGLFLLNTDYTDFTDKVFEAGGFVLSVIFVFVLNHHGLGFLICGVFIEHGLHEFNG